MEFVRLSVVPGSMKKSALGAAYAPGHAWHLAARIFDYQWLLSPIILILAGFRQKKLFSANLITRQNPRLTSKPGIFL